MDKVLVGEMKKLVKVAENQGEILPASEAFKMYPVEEEAHKGKLEYWTKGDRDAKC